MRHSDCVIVSVSNDPELVEGQCARLDRLAVLRHAQDDTVDR
jgi:hypothetical protein